MVREIKKIFRFIILELETREIVVVITTKESGQEDQNANGDNDVEEVISG